jgi:PKD repeat protein
VAKIVASPLSGDPPLNVFFDGRDSFEPNGEPLSYRWDFGDGSAAATGATVSHTFNSARTFTVVLRVTNPRNQRFGEAKVDIEVTNNSPRAVMTATPASGRAPLQVQFSAGQSSDRETPGDRLIYQWDFGDGSGANDARTPGIAKDIPHTFRSREDGTPCTPTNVCVFDAVLTVTDEGGKQSTATTKITVGNTNPVANVTASPVQGSAPLEVRFNAAASTDADGDTLRVDWVWGDGGQSLNQPLAGSDGNGNVLHTYAQKGTYRPTATIKDSNGGTAGWAGVDITVGEPVAGSSDPRAIFHICAKAPCTETDEDLPLLNETFAVDASQSVDRPAGGTITSYSWNFGDGSSAKSGKTQTHRYTQAGTYTITLTVKDGDVPANTGRFARVVIVESDGVPPGTVNQPPVPFFVVDPATGVANETEFRFDASASDDPDGDDSKLTFTWSFGDGATGAGKVVRHVYAAPNADGYVVRLTVRDEKNASRTLDGLVAVTATTGNRPPVAMIGTGLRTGSAPFTVQLNGANSFDPDGDPLEFRWEFREDDEVIDVVAGETIARVFTAQGTSTVELRVSDGRGGIAFAGPETIRVTAPVVIPPPDDDEPGQDIPDDDGEIPDSADQRPPSVCGMGMLMGMVGSLVGLLLMAVSRRRSA